MSDINLSLRSGQTGWTMPTAFNYLVSSIASLFRITKLTGISKISF